MNKNIIILLMFVFVIKGMLLEYYINDERYMLTWDYESDKVMMYVPIVKEIIVPQTIKNHWSNFIGDENCKYFKYCFEYGMNEW